MRSRGDKPACAQCGDDAFAYVFHRRFDGELHPAKYCRAHLVQPDSGSMFRPSVVGYATLDLQEALRLARSGSTEKRFDPRDPPKTEAAEYDRAARAELPADVEAYVQEVEGRAIPEVIGQGDGASTAADDLRHLIAIVREQGERIAFDAQRIASRETTIHVQSERLSDAERQLVDVAAERDALRDRLAKLETALKTALDEWEYASQYKGEFLAKKHGDAEDIAELRALLNEKGGT